MSRVLVTGGAGFIGSRLVDTLLHDGNDVVVVDDLSSGSQDNIKVSEALAQKTKRQFEFVRASIQDEALWKSLPPTESVFHLAAQTSVTRSLREPHLDFSSNVSFIPHLTTYMLRVGVRRLLNCNTAGALYGAAQRLPTPEDYPVEPLAPYGATKAMSELYFGAWTRALRSAGTFSSDVQLPNYFSWASLRLANVYGPGQKAYGEAGVVPTFFEKIMRNEAVTIFGDGTKTRDYIFVDDVAAAFLLAWKSLGHQALDTCFNIGTGLETTDLKVFQEISQALKKRHPSGVNLDRLPKFASIRPGEVVRSCVDTSKIKKVLQWKATVTFSDGIDRTIDEMLLRK